MRDVTLLALTGLVVALLAAPRPASAVVVDGRLDPDYGAPIVVQTTQTDFDDTDAGLVYFANGSELDAAYAFVSGGSLHLFFTGNLASRLTVSDFPDFSDFIRVYIDCAPGGQNTLIDDIPGLKFDSGFAPDFVFRATNLDSSLVSAGGLFFATESTLPTGGGGVLNVLGSSTPGHGTLTGGTNPFGIEATVDCSNIAGVTAGCSAASGAGVATGNEWSIPLAAIGNPTGCIAICGLVTDHAGWQMSNQVLGPVPPGTCALGPANAVDFSTIPGAQYFSYCTGATPTVRRTWGGLKLLYR